MLANMKTKWLFIVVVLLCAFNKIVDACTFPSFWEGTWHSSRRGDLTINSTSIDSINTTLTGPLYYTCFLQSGDIYIIRSQLIYLHNSLHRVYFCLEISKLTSASLVYYYKTTQNPQANNEPMKVYPAISSVTEMDLCDATPATTSWEMLVKQGSELVAATNCPNSIRGVYNYTVTLSSKTTCGLNTSSLDVCTNTTQPTVNMTLCNTKVAYSSGGLLQCVFSQEINSYSYTILFNLDATTDEVTTFRFTCLVSEVSSDYTYVSQYPQRCRTTQKPTSTPVGGGTLVLLPSRTCPNEASRLRWQLNTLLKIMCLTVLFFMTYT